MKRREFLKNMVVGLGMAIVPGPILSAVVPDHLLSSVSGEVGFLPINFYYKSVNLNENWMDRLEIGSYESVRLIYSTHLKGD